ncbi:MAG TPA: 2-oxo-4-hydroxy-4-carboxy-5-ureidoimidazoline decarboxylase [Candidatus Limnocylindria bacterium]|nr:2-oxo-4-hydroxy-4-carboxy-5-ureidoimidazoline decarboxylase [Candidatus Limnocylindria bacterium]
MDAAGGRIGAAFERAPLLVERLRGRVADGDDADAIMRTAWALIRDMDEAQRIAILDAHPRIGAAPATLSALSRAEQGSDADTTVLRELETLNDEYERRFGFRFVVFVHGRSKREIVSILRARLGRPRDVELAAALEEFLAISRDRLTRVSC